MGKKIDGFVLTAAVGVLLYLYFRSGTGSDAIAVILALMSCALLRKLVRRIGKLLAGKPFLQKRRVRREASGAILRLACLDEEDALRDVRQLLSKHYGGDFAVELVQAHPSEHLRPGTVFELWKKNRGCARLAVCTTCAAEPDCKAVAASLKAPQVAVVDSAVLTRLIAEHPEGLVFAGESCPPARLKLRKIGILLFNRRNAPKNLLLSLFLALLYFLTGNPADLLGCAFLTLISLISLRRAPAPEKLF